MPFLADAAGLRTGLAVVALVVGVPAILLVPAARRIDRRLHAPAGLELLQRLPIFVPIGPARLESLARHLVRTEAAAGDVIVTEGEVGDLFYLIESGRVAVSHGDAVIREQSSGEYFGEIALLRDVPRTATVTAVTDTVLLTVARAPFLDAVAGNAESSTAFEDVVIYRMRF
jgi:CRP-like cAMP-binding protein